MKNLSQKRNENESVLNVEVLEDRMMLSTVQILASGVEGSESMRLQIDGSNAQTWTVGQGAYQGQYQTYLDINGRMLSTQSNESTSKAVLDFMFRTLEIDEKTTSEDQCAAVWAAHFAVTGIACQQFHRGIPRSIFQIGGREKLTDLATSLFFAKNHLEKQVRPELPPTQHSVIDGHPYSWWQWLERKCGELAELKTGVFNNAYVESTVSFTQVLILHLQTRQKNNSTKPINGVLIRKRIFDAVNNFGIGDVEKIKSLEQVVQELFHIKVEKKPAE